MRKAQLVTETHVRVHCPNCGAVDGRVDHLFDMTMPINAGPWGCDSCGASYRLRIVSRDHVEVEIDKSGGVDVPCLHLLKLAPQTKPVFLVIRAKDYGRDGCKAVPFEGAEYFYVEHTCPTNWITDVVMIASAGDTDPHGLFEYVASVDLPAEHIGSGAEDQDLDPFIVSAFGAEMGVERSSTAPMPVAKLETKP